ncbi:MAG: MT-A70 family methyltransferase [Gaiellaceae bacterium]
MDRPVEAAAPLAPCSRPLAQLRLHPDGARVPAMSALEYGAFLTDVDKRGILVPLEIDSGGVLLDGRQRLRAARELGHACVPVQVVQVSQPLEYMLLAALRRRQLSPSQRAALALELDAYQRARLAAATRRRAGAKRELRATLPEARPRPRELAAELAGVSARTVQDVISVRECAPDLYEQVQQGALPAHRAARAARRRQRDRELAAPPPLPNGSFELIYADPPWQLGSAGSDYAPENHYPTLPLAEIKALQPPAATDAILFLWAVNCLLPQALELLAAWGFAYRTNIVWVKPSIGLGFWARNRHELLLLGRRGNYPLPERERCPDSVLAAPRGRHSEKPACFYELIERMYPQARRLELFARTARSGWSAWGNELPA